MSETSSPASAFRKNPKVEEAPVGTDLMLFDPAAGQFFMLNQAMSFVWKKSDGRTTLADIASALLEEFDSVPVEAVNADVAQAAAEMVAKGLLLTA